VDRALVKRRHLEWADLVLDNPAFAVTIEDAILWNHFSNEAPLNYQLELC
jgi:hypothetical protein